MQNKSKIEISKTPNGYFRVYKVGKSWAKPLSPREFSSIGDARKWVKTYKK